MQAEGGPGPGLPEDCPGDLQPAERRHETSAGQHRDVRHEQVRHPGHLAQTQFKSPYNTYQHVGLPPGPIDSPGNAAIQAALHPAHGTWRYFVTVDPKTGLTKFTNSPAQFSQFVAELNQNIKNGT